MNRLKILLATMCALVVGAVGATPASAAGIVFDEYPATAIANEHETHGFNFANRSVHCDYAGFAAFFEEPSETMTPEEVTPGSCTSSVESSVALKMNGCKFVYHPSPGSGSFDIGPPGCGPVTVEGSNCTRSIPAQTGLGASFTNQGSGSTATVRIDENAALEYTVTKGNFFVCAPMAGFAGYTGSWIVNGLGAGGEPVGARVVSQLPIGLYVDGEASEAEAGQPRFEAEHTPALVSGEQDAGDAHAISFQNRIFQCDDIDWAGEVTEPAQSLALTSSYEGCEAVVLGNLLPATIEMNSCSYRLQALNVGPPYAGAVDVACANEGDAIEAKVYNTEANPETDPPLCAYEVGPQNGLGSVGLDNQGQDHDREIAVDLDLTGIAYSRTVGKSLTCWTSGNASYSGTSILRGHE